MAEKRGNHYIHKKKEGLAAGTLLYTGAFDATETVVTTHLFKKGSYRSEEGLAEAREGEIRYIEICGLSDLEEIITIAKGFSISNLSLEDAFSTNQRIKLDVYDSYLSVTLRISEPREQQITLFLGAGWVLSIAEAKSAIFTPLFAQLATASSKLQGGSASMLLSAIIDTVVDQYLLRADELELATEELEEMVITRAEETDASAIHHHKGEILRLRRMTSPLRELLSALIRSNNELLDHTTIFLLRDVQDHALWLAEECEMLRETVSGIMEVYLSSLDMRMNSIMKVLTIISTIFIPLTFLTGLYGMNFIHIPFSTLHWGFYAILAGCVIVVIIMALYFRKKQWW
ncbi:MAG TPA: magnesium and cobalt transport protein CorA [Sphaerochaeta sp.]|jgi:magnesium transporter|nr:magnesium and cobalt transport protein CorA [Sphaerochaeta sp.]HPK47639.1 magnesium and cobalt transport protein CorA [Sphaerochaeta sp.]